MQQPSRPCCSFSLATLHKFTICCFKSLMKSAIVPYTELHFKAPPPQGHPPTTPPVLHRPNAPQQCCCCCCLATAVVLLKCRLNFLSQFSRTSLAMYKMQSYNNNNNNKYDNNKLRHNNNKWELHPWLVKRVSQRKQSHRRQLILIAVPNNIEIVSLSIEAVAGEGTKGGNTPNAAR